MCLTPRRPRCSLCPMSMKTELQDVRIRGASKPLVRKLKMGLVERDMTLAEWFAMAAAKTVEDYEKIRKASA